MHICDPMVTRTVHPLETGRYTVRGLVSELSSKLFYGQLWLVVWSFFCGHLYATTDLKDQVVNV